MHQHPSAPAPVPPSVESLVRVAGGADALLAIQQILQTAGCSAPGCNVSPCQPGAPPPNPDLPLRQMFDQVVAPDNGGDRFGMNAIVNGACRFRDGRIRPVLASYIGGTYPAAPIGTTPAVPPGPFNMQTNTKNFMGIKLMMPDALMGVGLGVLGLKVQAYDYLDLVAPIPVELFDALSSTDIQGRIDLCWLLAPNGFATVTTSAVASGTTAATTAQLVALQGFAAST